MLVFEQLPDSNPVKKVAAQYITQYEAKYGKDSRTTFGGHAYDPFMLLSHAVPEALKKAKPGTKEFRAALRDALENEQRRRHPRRVRHEPAGSQRARQPGARDDPHRERKMGAREVTRGPRSAMDLSIAAFLTQDGVTNGAIYALLALALVLVFTVTRIIWIPSGEFVTYGTLTLAGLQLGKPPGHRRTPDRRRRRRRRHRDDRDGARRRMAPAAAAARAVARPSAARSPPRCGGRRRARCRWRCRCC